MYFVLGLVGLWLELLRGCSCGARVEIRCGSLTERRRHVAERRARRLQQLQRRTRLEQPTSAHHEYLVGGGQVSIEVYPERRR
jgi:hypothetical protein